MEKEFSLYDLARWVASLVARSFEKNVKDQDNTRESFARHVHGYVTEMIKLADQKAGFLFALDAGLLGYAFKKGLHTLWFENKPIDWCSMHLISFFALLFLSVGLVYSYRVVAPNLKKSHKGPVFFRSIAEYESHTEYVSSINRMSSPALTVAILSHSYDISKVCDAKYHKLFWAIWCSAAGIVLFVLTLMWDKVVIPS